MENNALLNQAQPQGADELLKVTALWYFKDALEAQQYENCPELISAAKNAGATQSDVSAVIKEYLDADAPLRQKGGRVRSY